MCRECLPAERRKMREHQGACEFCGQIIMIEGPEDMTPEEIDREATLHCECKPALIRQNEKKFKDTAYSYIDMMVKKEGINAVLKAAADLIATHEANQMTITHGGMKYSIKRSKTGPKVEVTTTEKEVME